MIKRFMAKNMPIIYHNWAKVFGILLIYYIAYMWLSMRQRKKLKDGAEKQTPQKTANQLIDEDLTADFDIDDIVPAISEDECEHIPFTFVKVSDTIYWCLEQFWKNSKKNRDFSVFGVFWYISIVI